jgi:phosphopentomutase
MSELHSVSDFAASRGVKHTAVAQYIRRHPDEFSGHVEIHNNALCVDSEGLVLLEKKYPPRIVEVIEDTEARQKLIAAQEQIISLQQQLTSMQARLAQADVQAYLLEDREHQIAAQEKQISAQAEQIKSQNERINRLTDEKEQVKENERLIKTDLLKEQIDRKNAEKRAEEAEAKVNEFRSAGLLGRIFWKG